MRHTGMHAVPIAVAGCRTFDPIDDRWPKRSKTYASHFPYPVSSTLYALSHYGMTSSEQTHADDALGKIL